MTFTRVAAIATTFLMCTAGATQAASASVPHTVPPHAVEDQPDWALAAATPEIRLLVNNPDYREPVAQVATQRGNEPPQVVLRKVRLIGTQPSDRRFAGTRALVGVMDDGSMAHISAMTGQVTLRPASFLAPAGIKDIVGATPQGWLVGTNGYQRGSEFSVRGIDGSLTRVATGYTLGNLMTDRNITLSGSEFFAPLSARTDVYDDRYRRAPLDGGAPQLFELGCSTSVTSPRVRSGIVVREISAGDGEVTWGESAHYAAPGGPVHSSYAVFRKNADGSCFAVSANDSVYETAATATHTAWRFKNTLMLADAKIKGARAVATGIGSFLSDGGTLWAEQNQPNGSRDLIAIDAQGVLRTVIPLASAPEPVPTPTEHPELPPANGPRPTWPTPTGSSPTWPTPTGVPVRTVTPARTT